MKRKIFLSLMFFLLGFLASNSWHKIKTYRDSNSEIHQGGYTLTNPLLECKSADFLSERKTSQLRKPLEKEIAKLEKEHSLSKVSVYYRDLNNGPWFGINEKERFSPASLLKVPVLIAYLKEAELDHQLLEKTILVSDKDLILEKNIPDNKSLRKGESYTIENLLERMIIFSDNDSFAILTKNIEEDKITKVHSDLSIPPPNENSPENYITTKAYSSFFRVLYNASYLNREMSEKALGILKKTTYREGIVSGLPEGTYVAHKFGIREYPDSNDKQLHDCGIIYATNNPYLLCIMTRGEDLSKLTNTIERISSVIYNNTIK